MSAPRHERAFAQVRRDLGISLDRGSLLLGVQPTTLRELECSRRPVPFYLAERMARVYGAPLGQLFSPPTAPEPAAQAKAGVRRRTRTPAKRARTRNQRVAEVTR